MKDDKELVATLPYKETLLNDFVIYAAQNGSPARWYYINLSKNLIISQLKALIARDVFGRSAFYPIINENDKNVKEALDALNKDKAKFPIVDNTEKVIKKTK